MLKPVYRGAKNIVSEIISPTTKVGIVSIGSLEKASCYVKQLDKLFKDPAIKAIVLKMDCPGGNAGTSQAIYEEIKAYKQEYKKPIISFVENVCASGGYYIACATDTIIATPSAFIGSIGVYVGFPKAKDFINQFKIDYPITTAGEYKAFNHTFSDKLTARQQAHLTELTQDTYDQFVTDVSNSRPQLAKEKSKEWAEGKIFTGRQALAIHMIDAVGAFTVVENTVKKLAAIEGKISWIKHPKKRGMFANILGAGSDDGDDSDEDQNSFVGSCIEHLVNCLCEKFSYTARV